MSGKKGLLQPPVNKALLSEIVSRLINNLNPLKIILFGSYAYGQPNKDSDLDLLVVIDTKERGVRRYAMLSKLLEPRKVPIDIIVKTPGEIEAQLAGFNPFLKEILQRGTLLYEGS